MSRRRPLQPPRSSPAERIATVAACAWVAGLIAWYAGAHAAIDRLLDGMTLFVPVAVLAAIGGLVALALEPKLNKAAFANAVFMAGGLLLFGFCAAALLNRHADRSGAETARATVLSFHDPAKGPREVRIRLAGEQLAFDADHAAGCGAGSEATVELRAGAFGAGWLQSLRCE